MIRFDAEGREWEELPRLAAVALLATQTRYAATIADDLEKTAIRHMESRMFGLTNFYNGSGVEQAVPWSLTVSIDKLWWVRRREDYVQTDI